MPVTPGRRSMPSTATGDWNADCWLWQGIRSVWPSVRVLGGVALEPSSGARVTLGGESGVAGANGVATLGTRRGAQAVQVCAAGHVAWEGALPFVSGFSSALYLVPAAVTVTFANHQDMMEAAYNIAVALTPILTELNGTVPVPSGVPPTDDDLRARRPTLLSTAGGETAFGGGGGHHHSNAGLPRRPQPLPFHGRLQVRRAQVQVQRRRRQVRVPKIGIRSQPCCSSEEAKVCRSVPW
jgi:hypothetical protein